MLHVNNNICKCIQIFVKQAHCVFIVIEKLYRWAEMRTKHMGMGRGWVIRWDGMERMGMGEKVFLYSWLETALAA